jgi:TIR domain
MGALPNVSSESRSPRSRDRRPRIFISYRRSDSAAIVGHIYERLAARYKTESVFRDINKMPLGKNFYDHIKEELSGCDVVLVVVGPQWLAVDAHGQSRIQQSDDPVRLEVEAALQSGATVIPVMVEDVALPKTMDLPESLKTFPALAGTRINVEDFDHHLERLMQSIDGVLEQRGKFVASFPGWAMRAATGCTLAATAVLVTLGTMTLLGRAPSPTFGLAGVTVISLGLALACALAGGDAAAKRRIPLVACQRRPVAFSVAGGALAFVVLLALGIYSPFLASHTSLDPVHLASELRTAFQKARDNLERPGGADFARAEALVDALKGMDRRNGHAWYFAGEIKRIQNRALFTPKSCFKGWPANEIGNLDTYQQDFYGYVEIALSLPVLETSGDSGSEICYQRPKGFCVQRTAWIYHLLANDFYPHALALTDRHDRVAALERARQHVTEARKYRRPEGGEGFDQCIYTTPLAEKIAEALDPSRSQNPTGAIQSQAR